MKRRLLICVVTMIIMCFASMTGWCLDKELAPHVAVLNEVYDELKLDKAEMENVIKYLDGLIIYFSDSLRLKTEDINNDDKIIKFKADFVAFYVSRDIKNKPKPTNENELSAITNLYNKLKLYDGSRQMPSPSPISPPSQKQSFDNAYVFLISLFVLILLLFLIFYIIIIEKSLHRRLNQIENAQNNWIMRS